MSMIGDPMTAYAGMQRHPQQRHQAHLGAAMAPQPPRETSVAERPLSSYLGPTQAVALFVGGIASSFALRWFIQGLSLPKLNEVVTRFRQKTQSPLDKIAAESTKSDRQTGIYFTEGLGAVLMFALEYPTLAKPWALAYLGATALGYLSGSIADGFQEVWVRREETQIRATLLNRLTSNFRQSIQQKNIMDTQLQDKTKARITQILNQNNIPYPEVLLKPLPEQTQEKLYRYPYEPYHFSIPENKMPTYRFGQGSPTSGYSEALPDNWGAFGVMKTMVFAGGLAMGCLSQVMLSLLEGGKHTPNTREKTFYSIFNLMNKEALFFTGNRILLTTVLSLSALARVGKMLIDGYREIEVTRQNASTELRYQSYNWLQLDPNFHAIAEEEALEEGLRKLQEAIPYERNNRQALGRRIQSLLTNIGRNSAPKYFQMTPPVNLAAARS